MGNSLDQREGESARAIIQGSQSFQKKAYSLYLTTPHLRSMQYYSIFNRLFCGYLAMILFIFLAGSDGIIIIDTTESEKACLKIYEEFRKITEKPLKAIIITHFHAGEVFQSVRTICDS